MKGWKSFVVLAAIIGTTAVVGACRKEVAHEPMKLSADVPATVQIAR